MRGLARMFNVNRTLIKFICYPEKLEHAKALYALRRKDGRYYKKDINTVAIKKHREKKNKLLNPNKKTRTKNE